MNFLDIIQPDCLNQLQTIDANLFSYGEKAAKKWRDIPDQEMRGVVEKIQAGIAWEEAIFEYTGSNKWLKNISLSPSRSLFLELFDLEPIRCALDMGSGWGQLTLALAERAQAVVSVETTRERLEVTHAVCQQEGFSHVSFLHGDVFDLPFREQSFDFILLCGVYEWLGNIESNEDPRSIQERALALMYQLLQDRGKLVIAIENRIGLKYLLGERDDHTKLRHVSYLPYEEAGAKYYAERKEPLRPRTYDWREYTDSLSRAGYSNINFYLAFPDYKLPQVLIPASQMEALRQILQRTSMPDEHDGSNGRRSVNNGMIRQLYRAMGNTDVLADTAPSFIIVAEKGQ